MGAKRHRCKTKSRVPQELVKSAFLTLRPAHATLNKIMTQRFPTSPPTGTPMLQTRPSAEARAMLALRRSAGSKVLTEPGPSRANLDEILKVAMRVPDHRKLEPWRFIVFQGEARRRFGVEIEAIYKAENPESDAATLALEKNRLLRAPSVVAVISSPNPNHKTPVWEQELSVGAVCYNLLLAANAAGWAGVWLTEWMAFHAGIAKTLRLGPNERIAGFIYLGTASLQNTERPRPNLSNKVTHY